MRINQAIGLGPDIDISIHLMSPSRKQYTPKGYGPVLIIIAIGLAVSFAHSLNGFGEAFLIVFSDTAWNLITSTGSGAHQWLWKPVLIADLVFYTFFSILMLAQLLQFFFKLRMFTAWFIRASFLMLLYFIWTITVTHVLLPETALYDQGTITYGVGIAARFLVLIPYLMLSRRVKNTFIY